MSKATDDLRELQSHQAQRVEVEGAVESAARLDDMIGDDVESVPDRGEDGEAKFGTAEAIALGIASSFILGPVGILLGGVHGWLKKDADQAVLDTITERNSGVKAHDDVYAERFASLKASATEDADIETLGMIKGLHTMARDKLLSSNPKSRALGEQMMTGVDSALLTEFTRREDQEIARKANDDRLKIELDETQFNRNQTLLTGFDRASEGYEIMNTAIINMMGALEGGTSSDLYVATSIGQKIIDPTGVIKPEDIAAFSRMAGWLGRVSGQIQKAFNGEPLTADQKREIGDTFLRMNAENKRAQLQREAEWGDRVIDADLPVKYHDNYKRVKNTPAAERPDIPDDFIDETGTALAEKMAAMAASAEEAALLVSKGTQEAWDKAKSGTEEVLDDAGNIIRTGFETFGRDIMRGTPGIRRVN